jgi:membrane protein
VTSAIGMSVMKFDREIVMDNIKTAYQYLLFVWRRSEQDNIKVPAGHLAYVTLLSIVPLLAVIFYMLSAFPVFSDLKAILEDLIYNNMIPTSGDTIQEHISGFIENTKKMSMMGIGSLIVIALLLISTYLRQVLHLNITSFNELI